MLILVVCHIYVIQFPYTPQGKMTFRISANRCTMTKQQSNYHKSEELHPYASLLHELEELRSELKKLEQLSATT